MIRIVDLLVWIVSMMAILYMLPWCWVCSVLVFRGGSDGGGIAAAGYVVIKMPPAALR